MSDISSAIDWAERVANYWRQSPKCKTDMERTGHGGMAWALDRLTQCMSEIPAEVVQATINEEPRKGE